MGASEIVPKSIILYHLLIILMEIVYALNIMYGNKKIKEMDNSINESIDVYNRYKFEAKYQNHLLSEKMA